MVFNAEMTFSSKGFCDVIDITDEVNDIIEKSGISEGLATVIVPGATAGITTIEYEPGLVRDLKAVFEQLVPSNKSYYHDERWGDGNGFSHIRAALLGPGRSFPFTKGEMILGTWQQIVLVDFDNRPRHRKVVVQVLGE
jgi:secondary thiamine-phosphate synthase enzyme